MCTPNAQIAAVRISATTPKPIVSLRSWSIASDNPFSLLAIERLNVSAITRYRGHRPVPSTLTEEPHPTTRAKVESGVRGLGRRIEGGGGFS